MSRPFSYPYKWSLFSVEPTDISIISPLDNLMECEYGQKFLIYVTINNLNNKY
jgi:hypothetical protein